MIADIDESTVETEELRGWLSYEAAFQPYVLVGTAVLGPLVLQSLAAQNAFEREDHSIKCDISNEYTCDVPIGNYWVDTSAVVLYATSISVIIQMFIFLSLGSMADHGNLRKAFLFFFGIACGVFGLLILFVVNSDLWWLAFVSVNMAGVMIGAASILNFAYIPILARYSKEVIEESLKEGSTPDSINTVFDTTANTISYLGILYQSVSSLLIFIICAGFVLYAGDGKALGLSGLPPTYSMQIAMAACALLQILVMVFYSLPRFKSRPGPPLPPNTNYLVESYRSLFSVIAQARKLSQLFKMLVAWFVYSDSFSTVASSAILFGQSTLGAGIPILIGAAALVPLGTGIGIWVFITIQRRWGWTTQKILCIQASLYSLLPLYGIIGFFAPPNTFGMTNKYELLLTAFYHGFFLGATQSSCRVLFAELIPRGHEAQFFGLYEITDKGSTWIGKIFTQFRSINSRSRDQLDW